MKNMHTAALLIAGISYLVIPAQLTPAPNIGGSPSTWTPQHIQQLEEAKKDVIDAIKKAFLDKNILNAFAMYVPTLKKEIRKPFFQALDVNYIYKTTKPKDIIEAFSDKGGAKKQAIRVNAFADYLTVYLKKLESKERQDFFKVLKQTGCTGKEEIGWEEEENVSCDQLIYNIQKAVEILASKERLQQAIERKTN